MILIHGCNEIFAGYTPLQQTDFVNILRLNTTNSLISPIACVLDLRGDVRIKYISFAIPCQQAFCDGTLSFSLAPHPSQIARYMCINIFMKISYIVWLIWRILSMPKQLCSLLHIIFPLGAKFYLSLMTRAPIALNWSELINYARDSYTMSLCSSKLWQNTQNIRCFRRCLSAPVSRVCASVTTSVS